MAFEEGDCVIIGNVLTKDVVDTVVRYTVKADANSSERKQIACWVSSAYATTSQMLAAVSRIFSYPYSTPFCGNGGKRTTGVHSEGGAAKSKLRLKIRTSKRNTAQGWGRTRT